MKHTPGPWIVDSYSGPMYKITKPDFKPGDEVLPRTEADRILIQAAPEMFKALDIISTSMAYEARTKQELVNLLADYRSEAMKAISKAKGEF